MVDRSVTEVPDVVGLDAAAACEAVREAGLVPTGPDYGPEPVAGVITGQAPIGTAGAVRDSPVFLWAGHGGVADPVPAEPVDAATPQPA